MRTEKRGLIMSMSTVTMVPRWEQPLARPTARPLVPVKTPTPGAAADYSAPGSAPLLVERLARYDVAEPSIPRGDWADLDWECLAHRAGA
jgi:hypothetical protein